MFINSFYYISILYIFLIKILLHSLYIYTCYIYYIIIHKLYINNRISFVCTFINSHDMYKHLDLILLMRCLSTDTKLLYLISRGHTRCNIKNILREISNFLYLLHNSKWSSGDMEQLVIIEKARAPAVQHTANDFSIADW